MSAGITHNRAMEAYQLRIVLVLLGLAVLGLIYWLGREKKAQPGRREPTLPWEGADQSQHASVSEMFGDQNNSGMPEAVTEELQTNQSAPAASSGSHLGTRPAVDFEMIVSLHVMARDGGMISGPELIVATEKTSLIFGAQGLFHRLVDGHPELGPIFSVVNRIEPGRFDLTRLNELATPGISLFMALPCALPALEAWERMLPAAQRLAGLLSAEVYDEQMNLLGRQRIASLREELRNYDRKRDPRR